jgi:hypothetical protein
LSTPGKPTANADPPTPGDSRLEDIEVLDSLPPPFDGQQLQQLARRRRTVRERHDQSQSPREYALTMHVRGLLTKTHVSISAAAIAAYRTDRQSPTAMAASNEKRAPAI